MEIFNDLSRKLVFPIDYPSQRRVAKLTDIILGSGTLVSCLLGFYAGSLSLTLYAFAAAYGLALLLVVPAYGKYRQQKLAWVGSAAATTKDL
ncbi:AGR325Cp [Eremothecium gossypii ATCC 10895]|uniref:Signal peptidase complex subunit 1 n=1 Tax=Eremothecium gossypii (strain ATCC 10895 / CBS 109.51 / FGSC 9923 / NRRL Y-1056) TaxID=284811 RepID=SPC1_EREGS|nr:AGR325Cp [Eremothecium gossypii ATCC 10895]Q74Z81.1 RecName: Full=Signal peptidase complex subunit 1 [Eremothecium gossypii ATCC 10895]AAS54815.1 AGR325Cp [Eremothecium gossypii ATCC 10895]AEY99147.1 FAGR325Cp [Eremothecium gossypii FDAG1]